MFLSQINSQILSNFVTKFVILRGIFTLIMNLIKNKKLIIIVKSYRFNVFTSMPLRYTKSFRPSTVATLDTIKINNDEQTEPINGSNIISTINITMKIKSLNNH